MKQLFFFIAILLFTFSSCSKKKDFELFSPLKNLKVMLKTDKNGALFYQVFSEGKEVLESSQLGFSSSLSDFTSGMEISNISEVVKISDQYFTPVEKRLVNTYEANELTATISNTEGFTFDIVFRVSNDGVAFRYFFPEGITNSSLIILKEKTSFNLPDESVAWLHPHADVKTGWSETQPSYEENYFADIPVGTKAPMKAGWSYPALFSVNDQWVLISESGLEPSYCGTRLGQESLNGEYVVEFPQEGEVPIEGKPVTPQNQGPFYSPWRTLIIGELSTIVESNMITALATPSIIENPSFVKPGIASWSWGMLKDESVNYETQKQFIDYSSDMGWSYCLVDVNWDVQIGYEKIQELVDYASGKNVGILLWYNSSGDWNSTVYTPKNKMYDPDIRQSEFKRISEMGVKGIKVDFWPGDGPSAIQYYYDLLQDAAKFNLMVNCHGTIVTRGWSRTFPNLVTMESVKGFEFTTFEQVNNDAGPVHNTIIPFTRNVVGPMDFTPVCFDEIPGIIRRTSNAFELALSVVFHSGIQHIVETPESMRKQPDYVVDFMKNLPNQWDDIQLIDGYPGKYVVIARKANEKWYIGGINSMDSEQEVILDLSEYGHDGQISIITDGNTNRSFARKELTVNSNQVKVTIPPIGGFVTVLFLVQ